MLSVFRFCIYRLFSFWHGYCISTSTTTIKAMRTLFIVPIAVLLLSILFQTGAQAQFDVIYVKGKVFYKPNTAENDTPKEVRVGDKVEKTGDLDFTKDKSAYVALYNPSHGRIVVPDREDDAPPISSGTTGNFIRRRTALDLLAKNLQDQLNGHVIFEDTAKIDLTPLVENDVNAREMLDILDSVRVVFRFKYVAEDGTIETQENLLRDFHADFQRVLPEDRARILPIGRKALYSDSSGHVIEQRKIISRTELILRRPEAPTTRNTDDAKFKEPRKHKQIKINVQFRHPDSLDALKKEVQTLLNGYMVSGKNLNESIQLVIPYIEKYHGKVVSQDVEAWIRRNFTIEIKK